MDKALKKMQKTPLEDNLPIDNDDDVDGKPLVVHAKVAENEAGGGMCTVDLEIMQLKLVLKRQPTAW